MIKNIQNTISDISKANTIGIIGDPGCDGLGTYNMHVYTAALQALAGTDMILVAGDLVPTGERYFYDRIKDITNKNTELPVYVLPGNHDTGDYREAFGLNEYVLRKDGFALITLDNKTRGFGDAGLKLLKDTLADEGVTFALLAFHIPLPNSFSPNSVSGQEMDKLFEAMGDNKSKVKLLVCGHVHSRFEDVVQGIPMVCTGGGGAMIEDVSKDILASQVNHHIVKVKINHESLSVTYDIIDIEGLVHRKESGDSIAINAAQDAVKNELLASLKYSIYSDRAKRRGLSEVANVFEALARSEYHHARNFYSILTDSFSFNDDFKEYENIENYEYNYLYKTLSRYSENKDYTLSKLAYDSAARAESVHEKLLKNLPEEVPDTLYVCPTCGHLMTGGSELDRCPVCGCPKRDFEIFTKDQ